MTGRVLITGVASDLGTLLAQRLARRDDVATLVGVDEREPRVPLEGVDLVRADLRDLTGTLSDADIDTVVHLAVVPAPALAGGRSRMKEQNVIATMQLLAACQRAPSLRKVVVRSSTAFYGSDHTDPALLSEDATPRVPPSSGFAKDVTEVEQYARSFGRRRRDATVTILRFANFLGGAMDSLFARYLALPVVPTVLGFDPRLQFCHPDDAVEVLERVVVEDHPGVFNVAGPGILYLSQAIRLAGRVPAPIPWPFVDLAATLVRRSARLDFSPEQLRFLRFGRIGEITRLVEDVGVTPRWSTAEALADYTARRRQRTAAVPPAPRPPARERRQLAQQGKGQP